MDFKLKIAQRQQSNVEILQIIGEAIMKHPDLRFGQILAILDIIQYKTVNKIGVLGAHVTEPVDPFYEESVDMLIRVKNKTQNLNKNIKEIEN